MFEDIAVSPMEELGAYECLWDKAGYSSFKKVADLFRMHPGALPSSLVDKASIDEYLSLLKSQLGSDFNKMSALINTGSEYPATLRDARNPVEVIYYKGWLDLINTRSVAVVGSRKPSAAGIKMAREISEYLVDAEITVMSGLASGIDTVAHTTAIERGGMTIAVIGTPINSYYPKENRALQDKIAEDYLLVSQIPLIFYNKHDYRFNRSFFPERNITMSALSEATIIVEASNTSGTLTQARAALSQGRKLFILDSCFENRELTWPAKYQEKGAIRVKSFHDLDKHLSI